MSNTNKSTEFMEIYEILNYEYHVFLIFWLSVHKLKFSQRLLQAFFLFKNFLLWILEFEQV